MIQGDYYDSQTKLPLQGTNADIEQLSDAAGREKQNPVSMSNAMAS